MSPKLLFSIFSTCKFEVGNISDNFLQPSNPILLFDMFKSKRSFEKFLNNIEAPKYPILLLLKFI